MRGNYIYKRLGRRIAAERIKRGLSQEDMAGTNTLHRTHLARLEQGKINPSYSTLLKIARKFKIPLWKLLKEEKTRPRKRST